MLISRLKNNTKFNLDFNLLDGAILSHMIILMTFLLQIFILI